MEMPAIWDAIGKVTGLRILDLGCGGGEIGVELPAPRREGVCRCGWFGGDG